MEREQLELAELMEALLVSLGQNDGNFRSVVNGMLEVVAKCNALLADGKLTAAQLGAVGEQLKEVTASVGRLARAGEVLGKELEGVKGEIAKALPEIYTRLASVEEQEKAQGARLDGIEAQGNENAAAMREMAQVVVGAGEATGQAIATVHRLAQEGRDASREASQVVKTLAAGGDAIPRHPVAQALVAFRTLDGDARRTLAWLVLAAIGAAVVIGVVGVFVYLKFKGLKPA
jgi:methyl-accepting chemotaxis protein